MPVVTAGSIPTSRGGAEMAPGPDGGLYVLIDAPRELLAGPPSETVLALLDGAGRPRPGWPVKLSGWECAAPNSAYRAWSTAPDGSTRLVCAEDAEGDAPARRVAFAFDPAGRTMPGWPVELPSAGDPSGPSQLVEGELRVLAHDVASSVGDRSPQPGSWWVISVAADGTVHEGVRFAVPDIAPYYGMSLASDGAAYVLAIGGTTEAMTTEIVALDPGGVRAGWPLTVEGLSSSPAIGPDGRIYVTNIQGAHATQPSQVLVFEPDGRVTERSDRLPASAVSAWTGAGAGFDAPTVAPTGTTFIVGDRDGHTLAYAIDPSGQPMPGWPYRLPAGSQFQGACGGPGLSGCGVWRTIPAAGPDGTLYLPFAATDTKKGGSIVAIGVDGHVHAGWPVRLSAPSAGFWTTIVGSDGTLYAMAVDGSARPNSWTLYAIRPDGTVRARIPIVTP